MSYFYGSIIYKFVATNNITGTWKLVSYLTIVRQTYNVYNEKCEMKYNLSFLIQILSHFTSSTYKVLYITGAWLSHSKESTT